MDHYTKQVKAGVTLFLEYRDKFLMLKRNKDKSVDPDKMNGVGGKVEPGENYLDAAIRECEEETGYKVRPEDCKLSGIMRLESETEKGYGNDWIMTFIKIKVNSDEIPLGNNTDDGELMWLSKDEILERNDLVDDLYLAMNEVIDNSTIFYINAITDDNCKVKSHTKSVTQI